MSLSESDQPQNARNFPDTSMSQGIHQTARNNFKLFRAGDRSPPSSLANKKWPEFGNYLVKTAFKRHA
jgi:hypothetical protein